MFLYPIVIVYASSCQSFCAETLCCACILLRTDGAGGEPIPEGDEGDSDDDDVPDLVENFDDAAKE